MKQPFPGASQQTSCPAASLCFEVVSLNACLCFDVEFQTAFFPSVSSLTVPLWRWCLSTLCLRLDTSPSVSLKRRKTFIRYKTSPLAVPIATSAERLVGVHFIHRSLLVSIHHQNCLGISFWWHYLPSHNVIFLLFVISASANWY